MEQVNSVEEPQPGWQTTLLEQVEKINVKVRPLKEGCLKCSNEYASKIVAALPQSIREEKIPALLTFLGKKQILLAGLVRSLRLQLKPFTDKIKDKTAFLFPEDSVTEGIGTKARRPRGLSRASIMWMLLLLFVGVYTMSFMPLVHSPPVEDSPLPPTRRPTTRAPARMPAGHRSGGSKGTGGSKASSSSSHSSSSSRSSSSSSSSSSSAGSSGSRFADKDKSPVYRDVINQAFSKMRGMADNQPNIERQLAAQLKIHPVDDPGERLMGKMDLNAGLSGDQRLSKLSTKQSARERKEHERVREADIKAAVMEMVEPALINERNHNMELAVKGRLMQLNVEKAREKKSVQNAHKHTATQMVELNENSRKKTK